MSFVQPGGELAHGDEITYAETEAHGDTKGERSI